MDSVLVFDKLETKNPEFRVYNEKLNFITDKILVKDEWYKGMKVMLDTEKILIREFKQKTNSYKLKELLNIERLSKKEDLNFLQELTALKLYLSNNLPYFTLYTSIVYQYKTIFVHISEYAFENLLFKIDNKGRFYLSE